MTQFVDSVSMPAALPPPDPRVLIVDDDEYDQFILEQAVVQCGRPVQLSFAADGVECLHYLAASNQLPDLILLDLNMPRLNGLEVLQHVRAVPRWETLSVVILSTTNEQRVQQVASSFGVTEFLTKPSHYADYVPLVEKIYARYL